MGGKGTTRWERDEREREVKGRERVRGKADTRRDAARKFYCRSLRGFHLQIPRLFPFLGLGPRRQRRRRRKTSGEEERNTSRRRLPARNTQRARTSESTRDVAELSDVFFGPEVPEGELRKIALFSLLAAREIKLRDCFARVKKKKKGKNFWRQYETGDEKTKPKMCPLQILFSQLTGASRLSDFFFVRDLCL